MTKFNLGSRLKSLRLQRGFTMRELAKEARCSASFLSQLELNRASPSVANLEKICGALHISIVDFLREETPLQEPVQITLQATDHPLAMRWHGAWMRHLLPQSSPRPFTALRLTLEVGGEIPSRRSRRPINELAVVLLGEVELIANEKVFALGPQRAIYFDLGAYHQWRNVGTTVAEILMVHPYVFELFEQAEEDLIWSRRKEGVRLFK